MKYIDEYRDPALAKGLLTRIQRNAGRIDGTATIMEVCGSHTQAIGRFGIRQLLPENIRLISGPGCPVCVTSVQDVDRGLSIAGRDEVIFATFGDMMRVPGTRGNTLQKLRANGADIRVVSTGFDSIRIAEENRANHVVFMGIGFETTAPTVAAVIKAAKVRGIENLSLFSIHKVIPPAMKLLIDDATLAIDGFLCPGHVSTIIGANAYSFIADAGRAAVITGFEPVDILEGILMILDQIVCNDKKVEIQYVRGVKTEGNRKARTLLDDVFLPGPAMWRGLGEIAGSGLCLKPDFEIFDVLKKIHVPEPVSEDIKGCSCGDILRGALSPNRCPLFKRACTPTNPIGPCMVSSEGTCAAYYKYH